jgi:hypothetical protein
MFFIYVKQYVVNILSRLGAQNILYLFYLGHLKKDLLFLDVYLLSVETPSSKFI